MQIEQLKQTVIDALEEVKGIDIVAMDVGELTSVADAMIVVTGASARQVKALAENVLAETRKIDIRPLGSEGREDADWIMIDFGELLVHVMQPESREFYDLERLWGVTPSSGSSASSSHPKEPE